ncbi:Endo-1,3(4)-beta-glucanase 1 [Smittium culicis]|uniref:glucan endo-1,3-beta-D-glucosidase n=1 Tax=Smittium culicis TaxID=133412 RepID=A0A1R1X218_9FUNG|nr:Endo-1,3(4)-beta-glucanase 1 [Smittium culicis]OMJ24884.1 Endo-1,3(4)-beta-glucanase 1 [Smittium culicis]
MATISNNEKKIEKTDSQIEVLAIGSSPSVPFTSTKSSYAPNALWGSNISAPYPTNRWWINTALEGGDQPIGCLPYTVSASNNGVSFFYPSQSPSSISVTMSTLTEWTVGSVEGFSKRFVSSFDDNTMTYTWNSGNGGNMQIPFVKGSPYMTMKYNNCTPKLSYLGSSITSGTRESSLTTYKLTFANNRRWIVFSSEPIKLSISQSGELICDKKFNGYLRVAFVPDNNNYDNQLSVLRANSNAIPTGVSIGFKNGNSITHSYQLANVNVGSSSLLMLALPHHKNVLTGVSNVQNFTNYVTLKGNMTPVLGQNWTLTYSDVNTVTWRSPNPIPSSSYEQLSSALTSDYVYENPSAQDTSVYTRGKTLSRMARFALIADEIGNQSLVSTIVTNLMDNINSWLNSTVGNPLMYDTAWGGICTKNGLADFGADYGNGRYNDHYFHYGYFMYAAAVAIKLGNNNGSSNGTNWANKYNAALKGMLNDFVNVETGNNQFTRMRHFDTYDGHSWASGTYVFGLNRNQESSSEAVNAYYGAYLYSLAIGDTERAQAMNLILTSEIKTAQLYWQTVPGSVYNDTFAQNMIVGIFWETSAQYTTWFGNNAEYIYGIQMLPYTPISTVLLSKSWLNVAWPTIKSRTIANNPNIADPWKGFMLMAGAIVDKNGVTPDIKALKYYDNGNSKTNTLWWLSIC